MTAPLPAPGHIYAFRTSPISEFAVQTTNRYAAFKVIGCNDDVIVVAVFDSIWANPPSLSDVCTCGILREHRFLHTGGLAVFGMNTEWWNPSELDEVMYLGDLPTSAEELQLASDTFEYAPGSRFGTLPSVSSAAEGEWRWANDREALITEQERRNVVRAAKLAGEADRRKHRLLSLTWEQLLKKTPFEQWSPSPPFPPEEFTQRAREVIHDTCRALCALGTKPTKPDVRRLLQECVEWFNKADEQAGYVIETEERDDICAVLEEMAYVARQKSLVSEIDSWRNW